MFLKIWNWLVGIFWKNPTDLTKASEVAHNYETVTYRGTPITMSLHQKELWDLMPRKEKQKILAEHKRKIKKEIIKIVEIEGKFISVKNKQYGIDTSTDQRNKAAEQPRPDKAKSKK